MFEKKIPLSEAYIEGKVKGYRGVAIAWLILAGLAVIAYIVLKGEEFVTFALLTVVLAAVFEFRRASLTENYELYKALQHREETDNEDAE